MNGLFPKGVRIALAPLGGLEPPGSSDEPPDLNRASAARKKEFRTGRHLARRLVRSLGHSQQAFPRLPNGAPSWPKGVVGSISHCEGLCAVAVANADAFEALGIDAEPNEFIEDELWPEVFTSREQETLRVLEPGAVHWSKLFFSAKEAYYKASNQDGLNSFLDLEASLVHGRLRVSPSSPGSPPKNMTYRLIDRWLITAAWTDPASPAGLTGASAHQL